MKITTCYTVAIRNQVKLDKNGKVTAMGQVNDRIMKQTAGFCLDALKYCANVFLHEWAGLSTLPAGQKKGVLSRKRAGDLLIHSTEDNQAKYPDFDRKFPNMPSYTRRAVVADALGLVSSYMSNHDRWEKEKPSERGKEPKIGFPDRYELTFYKQERDLAKSDKGIIRLKLFNGKTWDWHTFKIGVSDAKYIAYMDSTRKMLSPVVEKSRGRYRIRFSFEEKQKLVSDQDLLSYVVMAVDLGINAPASWCVMSADGTVHGKGVIHLDCDEGRLCKLINRKRMYQQAGKRSRSIYRMTNEANRQLSIHTCQEIMKIAVKYSVDCIVFEHLEKSHTKGKRYRERIHLWRANDVQDRVTLQAHRHGMRISRVCAWGTSKLAFDGSGAVLRGKKAGLNTYSVCRFQNGKVYNCDLSASQNIGARYFLREYAKIKGCPELPRTPQRTYATLISTVRSMTA